MAAKAAFSYFPASISQAADAVKRLCAKGMKLRDALRAFYSSQVYAALEERDTGLWREPTQVLLALFDEERRTGSFSLEWSE